MDDISLCIPWDSLPEMETELNTMIRIHKKNMREICELQESIKNLPIFSMMCLVKRGHCGDTKKHYLEEENKNLNLFKQYNSEYNLLLQQEAELLQKIKEIENLLNHLAKLVDKLEDQQMTAKKLHRSQKFALNVAKRVFEESFGVNVIAKGQSCNDVFKATITFSEINDFSVTFIINRVTSAVLDFETNSIAQDELEKIKMDFKKTKNSVALISTLKNLAIKKAN